MPANTPRRILFHISPFASQKILTFHLWWICDPQWRSRFQPMLERLYPGSEFAVCCNTETMTVLEKRGYTFERDWRAFTLDQSETLDHFKYRTLESLDHWHRTGENNDHGRYLGAKLLEKFGGWTPDLVFSFLPAPYLRDAWPDAQIVYLESSVFSRDPYPWTYYFDALGTMQNAFLSRYAAQINALDAPPETLRAVAEYRTRTAALFERETRVKEYFAELRKRFRHIFLFACNLDHYFGVEAFSPYETQFEFLEHVMTCVPPDTAVVVTQHPEPATTPLPERCLNDLKDVYPNLIADDFFFNMTKPSSTINPSDEAQIGYDYQVDFDITWAAEPLGTILLEGPYARVWLTDPINGWLGFSRDGYLYTFRHKGKPGRTEHISIRGTNRSTSLFIDGRLVQELGIEKVWVSEKRKYNYVRTLVFPLQRTGNFRSRITNFEAKKI